MTTKLELSVLGPVQVAVDGVPIRLGARSRALLLALALRRGEVVAWDRLVDLLWIDQPPGDARNAFQVLVSRVRRTFGSAGPAIVTREPGYALDLPAGAIDAARFEQRVVAARQVAAAGEVPDPDVLAEALSWWRGEPYAEAVDDPAAVAAASRLVELRREAVELRAEAVLARGGGGELVADLRAAVSAHPDQARTHRALALALYRSGREVEALEVLNGLRARLRDEQGLDLDQATDRLLAAMLRRDERLAGAATSGGAPDLVPDLAPEVASDAADAPVRLESGTPRLAPLPTARDSFVGRRSELAAVREAVGQARVVTLIGPGGTGKTRLAVEALRDLAGLPADGVAFVDLAPVGDPDDVTRQVAAALEIYADAGGVLRAPTGTPRGLEDRIRDRLRQARLVVLLDNCEHLPDAAAEVADLLVEAGPDVRVLATSREALRVDGEQLLPVAPLAVPTDGGVTGDPEALLEHDAVRLFADRARAAGAELHLDAEDAAAVVELCRRLDGLPLALELAAARVSTLPVTALAARLEDRFQLLTGGRRGARRQRTLDAVVAWSYDLLDGEQQRLLRRLGAFAGPVDVDLVAAVVADHEVEDAVGGSGERVLPELVELADRSLLTLEPAPPLVDDPARRPRVTVRLLETIRAFAQDRLVREDDAVAVRRRHARAVSSRVAAAGAGLQGPDQLRWLDLLDRDQDECRAALAWWLETEPDRALQLAVDLVWYWWLRDHNAEAARWLRRALDQAGTGADQQLRATALGWLGLHELFDNRIAAAITAVRTAEAVLADIDAPTPFVSVGVPLLVAYVDVLSAEDQSDAFSRVEGLVARAEQLREHWVVATGRFILVGMAVTLGQHERARQDADAALAAADRCGDRWVQFQTRTPLGVSHLEVGRLEDAERELAVAGPLAEAVGARAQLRMVRTQQAIVAMLRGDHDRAEVELTRMLADGPLHGRDVSQAMVLHARGMNRRRAGDVRAAVTDLREAVGVFAAVGEDVGAAEAATALAHAEVALGELGAARSTLGLAVHHLGAVPGGIPVVTAIPALHEAAAAVALAEGDAHRALLHLGRAAALRVADAASLSTVDGIEVERIEEAARRSIGDGADAVFATGRGRTGLLAPID